MIPSIFIPVRNLLADATVDVSTGRVTGGSGGGGLGLKFDSFRDLVKSLTGLMNYIMPVLVALALVTFLYGVMKYVGSASSEADKADGKEIIIWGVLALSVMVGMWGFVAIVRTFFFGGI